MKKVKKVMVLLLAAILAIGAYPKVSVSAESTSYTVMEVSSDQTKVKEDCYAKAKTLETLECGDLVFVVGSKTNKHNNLWYRILFADTEKAEVSEAYVFSGDVSIHECVFEAYKVSDNATFHYCRCGQTQVESNGIKRTSEVAELPAGLLNPNAVKAILDGVAVARAIAAKAGAAVNGAVKALGNPFIVVPCVVTGLVFYVVMTCDGLTVSIDHVKENYKPFDEVDMDYGTYYPALVLPDSSEVLFMDFPEAEMDIDEAIAFMTLVAEFSDSYNILRAGERMMFGNVYTPNFTSAEDLCKRLVASGLFEYGGDKGVGSSLSVNKRKVPCIQYYRHYHLHYALGFKDALFSHNSILKFQGKVPGSHIFWGSPVSVGQCV